MAINEWQIWKKLGVVKEPEIHIDVEGDVQAILQYFKEFDSNKKKILKLFDEYLDLRRDEKILKKEKASHKELADNIKKQIEKYDQIIQAYEMHEDDTDVNGLRVKKIAKSIQRKAVKYKIPRKWINYMKKDMKWNFNW